MISALFLTSAIIIARVLFLKAVPFRAVSTDTAALAGVFLYFILPLAGAPELLAAGKGEYSLHVLAAYGAFMVGSVLGRRFASTSLRNVGRDSMAHGSQAQIYTTICLVLASYLLWNIYATGGIGQIIDNWTYGDIHRASLNTLERAEADSGMAALRAAVFQGVFVLLWTTVFLNNRTLGIALWLAYLCATMTEYVGRSALVSLALIPYLVHVYQHKLTVRRILVHLGPLVAICLVFGSWMSWFRLGARYDFSVDRVLEDTLRDVGGPMSLATLVLEDPSYRGSPSRYILSYVSFFVPRVLWPDKPGNELNATVTRMITGRAISMENSISTLTILGEGWFYFGLPGGVILMTLFGLFSTIMSSVLSRSLLLSGVHAVIIVQTLFELRSTLLYYVQFSVLMAVAYVLFRMITAVSSRDTVPTSRTLIYATSPCSRRGENVTAP